MLEEKIGDMSYPELVTYDISADGSTRKDLLHMQDGAQIETVLLRYRKRYSVCVSTQVGCACGCRFCATGQMGFTRQLSAEEMLTQVLHFRSILAAHDADISNVVFMGMGEPLLNEDQTLLAVEQLVDPRGLGLAPGRITLSSVGIASGIRRLADRHSRLPIKLAVSLHAATEELRRRLMPVTATHTLESLFEALGDYTERTRRRVLFEWIMIRGVNDTAEQADALGYRLQSLPSHVNLIQLNPTPGYTAVPSLPETVAAFAATLDRYAIPHTMRQQKGGEISAGCGQLSARHASCRSDHTC